VYLYLYVQCHALTLRRAVGGRCKSFDELLAEYRKMKVDAKEASDAVKKLLVAANGSSPHRANAHAPRRSRAKKVQKRHARTDILSDSSPAYRMSVDANRNNLPSIPNVVSHRKISGSFKWQEVRVLKSDSSTRGGSVDVSSPSSLTVLPHRSSMDISPPSLQVIPYRSSVDGPTVTVRTTPASDILYMGKSSEIVTACRPNSMSKPTRF